MPNNERGTTEARGQEGTPGFVLPLAELHRGAIDLCGGKAANLGELVAADFPVPDGFCVTTLAYVQAVSLDGAARAEGAHLAEIIA